MAGLRTTSRSRLRPTLAAIIVGMLVVAACGNADDESDAGGSSGDGCPSEAGGSSGDGRPGVTDGTIRLGGVISKENPIGQPYDEVWDGAKLYFDRLNAEGGLYGREIELLPFRNDQSRASEQIRMMQQVVEEDDVFAVMPVVSNTFADPCYLVEHQVPTFGWNIQAEWASGLNLFGEKGSYLCFGCGDVKLAWFAEQIGAERVAILSYGVPQSRSCAEGIKVGMEQYGIDVGYVNTSLSFGFTDISADARRIRADGADLLMTCMDVDGNVRAARALQGTGIEILSPQGYDPRVPVEYGADVEGFYFRTAFVPFEAREADAPGMDRFLAAIEEEGLEATELLLAGWLNAQLFHDGMLAAGEDFTRQGLIDAINDMDDWTADGIVPNGVNWTHHGEDDDGNPIRIRGPEGEIECNAWLQIRGGEFVPVFGEPAKPLACHPRDGDIDAVSFT